VAKRIVRTGFDGYPFIVDAGGFGSLGAPLLNNSNLCAYSGNYSPGYIFFQPLLHGTPVTNFLSVYGGRGVWTSLNTPTTPSVFIGQTAPEYNRSFTTSVGTSQWFANLVFTNAPSITNPPVTFTNQPSFTSIDGIALSDAGRLIFSASVATTNYYNPASPTKPLQAVPMYIATQPLLQRGIWGQDSQWRLVPIIREGEPLSFGKSNRTVATLAPELPGRGVANRLLCYAGIVNPAGETVLNASFTDGTQAIVVASARSNGLLIASMTGDSAPGGANKDFFLSFASPPSIVPGMWLSLDRPDSSANFRSSDSASPPSESLPPIPPRPHPLTPTVGPDSGPKMPLGMSV